MNHRLPIALSAAALVVTLLSNGSLVAASTGVVRHALFADRASTARHASTADTAKLAQRAKTAMTVDGIRASRNVVPGQLVPLGSNGRFPESVLPLGSTANAQSIGARVWSDVSQAIPGIVRGPNTPETYLDFDQVAFDTAHLFNPATPDRLTIPVTGIYLITATVSWAHSDLVNGELSVRLVAGGKVIASDQVVAAYNPSQSVTAVDRLSAGDTAQVVAGTHNDGTVIPFGDDSPALSVALLAPG